jgi:hypothetical protein
MHAEQTETALWKLCEQSEYVVIKTFQGLHKLPMFSYLYTVKVESWWEADIDEIDEWLYLSKFLSPIFYLSFSNHLQCEKSSKFPLINFGGLENH